MALAKTAMFPQAFWFAIRDQTPVYKCPVIFSYHFIFCKPSLSIKPPILFPLSPSPTEGVLSVALRSLP